MLILSLGVMIILHWGGNNYESYCINRGPWNIKELVSQTQGRTHLTPFTKSAGCRRILHWPLYYLKWLYCFSHIKMISIYADGIPAKCHDDALMFALYPSTQNKETRAVAMAPAYLQKNTDPAVDAWISEGNSDACTGPRAGYIRHKGGSAEDDTGGNASGSACAVGSRETVKRHMLCGGLDLFFATMVQYLDTLLMACFCRCWLLDGRVL